MGAPKFSLAPKRLEIFTDANNPSIVGTAVTGLEFEEIRPPAGTSAVLFSKTITLPVEGEVKVVWGVSAKEQMTYTATTAIASLRVDGADKQYVYQTAQQVNQLVGAYALWSGVLSKGDHTFAVCGFSPTYLEKSFLVRKDADVGRTAGSVVLFVIQPYQV